MLYSEYIQKAKAMCLAIDDINNMAYLLPDYRYILHLSGMKLEDVTDFPGVTPEIVAENLKLEADGYNARNNMVPGIAAWLRETILDVLSPIAAQEQDELIKNLVEYMKATADKKEAEAKADEAKAKAADAIAKVQEDQKAPVNDKIAELGALINFSKK